MITEIFCPKPQRPLKRSLTDTDSDPLPVSKHARRSLPPLPTLSTNAQRFKSLRPPRHSSSQSLDNLDPYNAPPKKRRRLQSPRFESTEDQHLQVPRSGGASLGSACVSGSKRSCPPLPTVLLVDAWLSTVSPEICPISPPNDRPSSCPAALDVNKHKSTPLSLAAIQQMSQQQSQYGDNAGSSSVTSQSGRPGTSHPMY